MKNLYAFKGFVAKELVTEFPNKGWGLGTEWSFEKAARNWHDSCRWSGNVESIQSLVFLFCNIHTQTGYYKKRMCHLVANFLSCYTAKHSDWSTFDRVITKMKRVNLFF